MVNKIIAFISNAQKVEREGDIEIHEQKIYHAFYNKNLNLSDSEIAESLERVAKRLKMDLQQRKDQREKAFLDSELALDNIKTV
jgi:hypothetical protein